jgi:hypothetical protein
MPCCTRLPKPADHIQVAATGVDLLRDLMPRQHGLDARELGRIANQST